MTPEQKEQFIRSLCDSVRDTVIQRIPYMPEAWDGIELREYLAREFEAQTYKRRDSTSFRRRLRDFKNDVATRTGL